MTKYKLHNQEWSTYKTQLVKHKNVNVINFTNFFSYINLSRFTVWFGLGKGVGEIKIG